MPKIYRYEIKDRSQTVHMPSGAVILSATAAKDCINLYALADLEQKPEPRHFLCTVTGDDLPGFIWDCVHIATMPGGSHLWEVPDHHVKPA